jgi:hypothetical protein
MLIHRPGDEPAHAEHSTEADDERHRSLAWGRNS